MPSIFKLDLKRFMVLVVLVLYDKITSGIVRVSRGSKPSIDCIVVRSEFLKPKLGMTLAVLIIIDDVDLLKRLINCLILILVRTQRKRQGNERRERKRHEIQ